MADAQNMQSNWGEGMEAKTTEVAPSLAPIDDTYNPLDHPFVKSVKELLDHLAGQPQDAYMQPLYLEAKEQLRIVLGLPERKRDTSGDGNVQPATTAQAEREAATQIRHP